LIGNKRKALDVGLQRRVRARREDSEELEDSRSETTSSSNDPALDTDRSDSNEEDEGDEDDSNVSPRTSSELEPEDAASISFGALAKAEASIAGTKSKNRATKNANTDSWSNNEALERKAGRKDTRGFERASKHAPTEISSKKAVSRKREVILVPKRESRDPRFDAMSGQVDEGKIRKAFAFLDDYRDDEMKELRNTIKNTKDEGAKDGMKRHLIAMESRKKAQARKDKHAEVLDRYRKEEKELVKQGKQPFYLKKAEQNKRVLMDQYGALKGKQLDRVIERRRKKVDQKEKKKMPWARREAAA
ncbi:hypothetical protein BJ875DRAFT_511433, partial [Amylocarpus encephaloides]